MKKARFSFMMMFLSVVVGLVYFGCDTAEAGRMGGGRSFGSRPSYQRSAPAPSRPQASPQAQPSRMTGQQPAAAPSPMGRWGGMIGGFMMGGLLGSMLFGGGRGFGGPGLMDMLLIGGGLFLLFRFLRTRGLATGSAPGASAFERGPGQMWGSSNYTPDNAATVGPLSVPPGFDVDDFLKGANVMYARLQSSWDKRDLDDIRQFTSNEVLSEIQQQAKEDPTPGKTELLMVNPQIIEVREVDSQTIVSVLYDVLLRESEDEVSKQVRELWHFSQERNKPEAFWVLEGIQQIER